MRRAWIVSVTVLGFMGCAVGPTTRDFGPAAGPQGIAADLRVKWGPKGRLQGELLEVQDTALVLLSANRVTLVPIRGIQAGRFSRRGTLIEAGRVSQRSLARLRTVSRFPAGLTPEVRTRLLAAYGQTAPDGPP
jgi:hypothetical protein